ncbi:hypothetical protein [Streptomyces purpurogeneiscleroticus]|uniref:hypothetical protein n=1 Tax=Streptomyces purpurogeneiscleroticus TaxID=68259 RepID=UPI001CC1BEE4|nr:hypothetical protein [Streptomyces purpurogeneiscleroticus]MBZ4018670.1 hypothetical protein [Streptomyces purpurogeneiscleroticus]
MSAHQSLAAAARRDDSEPSPFRREDGPGPTMNELLASCAAANAVSTPPEAPAPEVPAATEARTEPVTEDTHLPNSGRDAA